MITTAEMGTPQKRRLKFQNQVAPHWAHLAKQKRQPDQEMETRDAANKCSLQSRIETFQLKDDQTPTKATQTPNKAPIEEVHISKENYMKFGSITREIESLRAARMQSIAEIQNSIAANSNKSCHAQAEESVSGTVPESDAKNSEGLMFDINLDKEKEHKIEVITINSDEEGGDGISNNKSCMFIKPAGSYGKLLAETILKKFKELNQLKKNGNYGTSKKNYQGKEVAAVASSIMSPCEDRAKDTHTNSRTKEGDLAGANDREFMEDTGMVEDVSLYNSSDMETDGSGNADLLPGDDFEECWRDMDLAMETAKENEGQEGDSGHIRRQHQCQEEEEEEDVCIHDCKLDEQHGLVCRICGLIEKKIDTIFEYQWHKPSKSIKTYPVRPTGLTDSNLSGKPAKLLNGLNEEITGDDIAIHPRHRKHIRPHQLEGFNFLVKNLTGDNPGGCILAHAPGSGKTFMLISFIQSFLGRYPNLRPLIVLPKGIIPTWRKEFKNWQIEDIPLFDFYTRKADTRSEQLEILKIWEEKKSVLLLGYQQFASIVTDEADNSTVRECRDKLLYVPELLILDEGHTPRNEETNCLNSLAKVQTVRKVVLSGTLFQNHVKEVFNIVNLIRPRFLVSEHARPIVRRILSQVNMSGRRNTGSVSEALFCELVEETLKQEQSSSTKIEVIRGLRNLTENILHYYKGDLLDDLPGLCDFTVMLNLTARQKRKVKDICRLNGIFKRNSSCALVSVHPSLEEMKDNNIDTIVESLDISEGVKARFVLNLLSLAVSNKEKVLVFGRYLNSLKLLEKLVINTKGWTLNKEVFRITGSTSQNDREWATDRFNNSKDAKILFGSVKACGEGISLVGASRLVILDQHANPSVTRQVVGRAFRPGQVKKVFCYRLVACESPEEEEHATSLCKEVVSKMWFEWKEHELSHCRFGLDTVNFNNCGDVFFESDGLRKDVNALYKR
ncbi:DNA repair/recombination protein [Rhynchospora pubera]|uniref:DNA repair/recombination protein n=1 Tax=Rhynchospora pubera TaxID=906938 RepID=A0AAV8HRJ8_9POAL|nr:DNA repair/recombination protein [Rhynchospora pubera]